MFGTLRCNGGPWFATVSTTRIMQQPCWDAGPAWPTCAARGILHANRESCLLATNLAYYLGILLGGDYPLFATASTARLYATTVRGTGPGV